VHALSVATLTLATLAAAAAPAAQNLNVGQPLQRFDLLREGAHRYLRYTVKDGERKAIDIWSRVVSFEQHDGRRMMHIVQRWDEASQTPFWLVQDSWFDPGTFRPLTHVRTRSKDGKVEIGGYRFLPDRIVGLSDLKDNLRKDFVQSSP